MEISTFLIYKVFGRLTPNYESGFEDRKILNLKVNFICQKSKLKSAFFHSINQGSDGEVAEKLNYDHYFFLCFIDSEVLNRR